MVKKAKGKHRLDKFYHLAKEQGFRSRAAFKLIQLNRQFGFLDNARSVLDLCAAPGGWLQVAAKALPAGATIVGVDLDKIRPIAGVKTLVGDITAPSTATALKRAGGGVAYDAVLHDGAPNVGGAWASEAYSQSSLVLDAARLACAMLAPGGTFVTKVFRSKDYTALLYALKQLFARVDATKPPASRSTSAEIFVVCRGYKAPARLDPRILDARHLFKDSGGAGAEGEVGAAGGTGGDGGGSGEAPLSNAAGPDALLAARAKRGRSRSGYADGLALIRTVVPAAAFIMGTAPVELLGRATVLEVEGPGAAGPVPAGLGAGLEGEEGEAGGGATIDAPTAAAVASHPATTREVRALCADLGVLGRSEFKALLKWRAAVRKALVAAPAAAAKKEAEAARAAAAAAAAAAATAAGDNDDDEAAADKEDAILDEIADAKGRADAAAKREKKKAREAKKKARLRAAAALAAEGIADAGAEEGLFSLATLEKAGAKAKRAAAAAGGDLASAPVPDDDDDDEEAGRWRSSDDDDDEPAADGDVDAAAARYAAATEAALDEAYNSYLSRQGRRAAAAAEKEAAAAARKRARFGDGAAGGELEEEEEEDGEAGGLATAPLPSDDDDDDDDDEGNGGGAGLGLLTDLSGEGKARAAAPGAPGETTLAARWFGADPLFAEDDAAAVAAGDGGSDDEDDDDAALDAKAAAAAARRRGAGAGAGAAAAPLTPARGAAAATLKAAAGAPLPTAATTTTRRDAAAGYEEVPASPSRDSTSSDDSEGDGGGGGGTSDDEGAGSDGGLSALPPWERAATLATARAALRGRRRADILDAGYHRYAFNDPDGGAGLPAWFTDDERRHMRPPEVVSAAEVAAERAAAAAIDARPIKKVAQAKQRKAKRLTARLEAARKKAEAIVEGGGGGEDLGAKGKAREVAKLYARARAGAGALKAGGKRGKLSRSAKYTADKKGKPLDARLRADQRGRGAKAKGGKGGGKKGGGAKGKGGGKKGGGGGGAPGKSRKAGVAKRGRR